METRYFQTEFGESIEIIPGYAESIGRTQQLSQSLYERMTYTPGKHVTIDVTNFGKDLSTYALVMDAMDSVGLLNRQYGKALDIGGQEGIHPALFRAHFAEHVTSVDLMDGSDSQLPKKMKKIVLSQKKQRLFEYLYHDNRISAPLLQSMFPGRVGRRLQSLCEVVPTKHNYYNFRFQRDLDVDEFSVGDFVEKINGQFDIVLSFLTVSLMPYQRTIRKVSELLPSGGIFACIARYTYGPGACTLLNGDFPYFEKRLTKSDIKRYYREYKPEEEAFAERFYSVHDSARPTISQYLDFAYQCGLHPLVLRPMMVPYLNDTEDSMWKRSSELKRDMPIKDILRDIRHMRPEITLEDLFTSYFILILQKA
jgi:hypothetical protein